MLKAQQTAAIQNLNINLINIRLAEIQYFTNFFSSFAFQGTVIHLNIINESNNFFILFTLNVGSLVASFIVNFAAQIPSLSSNMDVSWNYIYGIGTAIAFGAAMDVLISCSLISVYAQGLALRGPVGSMVLNQLVYIATITD